MSKSKGDLLKEKFRRVIDRCTEAGNKKAAEVYKKVLKTALERLQKKSVDDLPDLKREALEAKAGVKAMVAAIEGQEKELDDLAVHLAADYAGQSEAIEEKLSGLAKDQATLNELVGDALSDVIIIQEIAMEILSDKE